jgi:pimeloyl-ACP methyl ester carboxylesterase
MSSSSAPLSTPEGPGSVSGTPNLPAGFIDTSELRQHAVIGGDGPPLLLVHGWPENWYTWRLLMPALARDFRGHRSRPAWYRADRQAQGRVRHRYPGR